MNRETMKKDLADLLEAAQSYEASVELLKQNLATEKEKLRATVDKYQTMRVALVEAELRERKLWWCTNCKHVSPAEQFGFIFIEGKKSESYVYGNSCCDGKDYSEFHYACQLCRNKFFDRHGQIGRGGVFFHAFVVEWREDGYHARKFGQWTKPEEEKCALPSIPMEVTEGVDAHSWDMPPILEIDYREGRENLKIRPPGILIPA
ncbi:MAG: hypothetical protein AAB766_00100 [Patescibacteria group bacterium]